ncbi:hypothetical protein C8J57DRAFT_1707227 [Mycena rebaudengoi]|nr:hypothetical protein C8J57DRAFT_1707227 [Mycena rebaudengoi]
MSSTLNVGHHPHNPPKFLPDSTQISNLREILRSNHVPPEETSHFQSVLTSSPATLAEYDAEIERLRSLLRKTVSDRATFHAYTEGCRSALSPIRRLPAELLVEIFAIVLVESDDINATTTPQQEMSRLSKDNLLRLSQVSFWWRGIVMGTPMLWSTIVVDMRQWQTHTTSTALGLISLSLERGGNFPLKIEVMGETTFSDVRLVLEKLIQQSSRWREVALSVTASAFGLLSTAKGRLPRLESLRFCVRDGGSLPTEVDVFETAPRLTDLTIRGRASNLPVTLPWRQLRNFRYIGWVSTDLPDALYLLSRLSLEAEVEFETRVSDAHLPLDLHSVVCEAWSFMMTLEPGNDVNSAELIFANILAHLALPNVSDFCLAAKSPCLLGSDALYDLASRSSFDSSLTVLELNQVGILDGALLQLLPGLPRLRYLYICDLPAAGPDDPERVIITDLLFLSLTSKPGTQPLVPNLKFLSLSSLLRFRDDIFLDLVTSRVFPCLDDEEPFHVDLLWLPGHKRELDRSCHRQLSELSCQNKLAFIFEMDDN